MTPNEEALALATDVCIYDSYTIEQSTLAAEHIRRLVAENERLKSLISAFCEAGGHPHIQIAICDLYDAVGLPNERPSK